MLQLVLYLSIGLSNVCFGSDYTKMPSPEWEIGHMSKSVSNPYRHIKELISGKLQFYPKFKDNGATTLAARFMPSDSVRAAIQLSNVYEQKQLKQELRNLDNNVTHSFIPLYILRGGMGQWGEEAQGLEVTKIEYIYETYELLDLSWFKLYANGNNIVINTKKNKNIVLHHPDNVSKIRQALSLNRQFIIKIRDEANDNSNSTGKVTKYENGAYIWWDGWKPSLKLLCVGMPMGLSMSNDPYRVLIDLNKEKEEIHHYFRNKLMTGGLIAAILILFYYNKLNC